jgi:hypothetical protein
MSLVETTLINGEDMSVAHRETFHIPSEEDRNSLQVGDHAKIGMTCVEGGERFWVKIIEVRTEQGKYEYAGAVDNNLVVFDIPLGKIIEFDAPHVLEVLRAQKKAVI